MKRIMISFLVLSMVVPAFCRHNDDLENAVKGLAAGLIGSAIAKNHTDSERKAAHKVAEAYNTDQPASPIKGKRVSVKLRQNRWSDTRDEWIVASVRNLVTSCGAIDTWSVPEIKEECRDRDDLSGEKWVDQSSEELQEGKIVLPQFYAEVTTLSYERREDFNMDFGRWCRGADFSFSSTKAYLGLIITIRRVNGTAIATYKVVGFASSADRASERFFNGWLGSQFGVDYRADNSEAVPVAAMEDAFKQMKAVFKGGKIVSPPSDTDSEDPSSDSEPTFRP